jgi:ABC-type cobalamin/Fe3+-siderophores transport system ATPase subunit
MLCVCYAMPWSFIACIGRPLSRIMCCGHLQALLGPSGAGKSSLLDILACRKATGSISGSLLLNGVAVTRAAYSRRIAYVPQVTTGAPIHGCACTLLEKCSVSGAVCSC